MSDIDFTGLRRFDMTMLLVFREIMRWRKLTVVAKRLGLTQSAISHTLGRLRDALGDPLFHRKPHGLEPTARALELESVVNSILDMARWQLLQQDQFNPKDSRRHLRIASADHHAAILGAPLSLIFEREAPHMRFSFIAAVRQDAVAMLDANAADLIIGLFGSVPATCDSSLLYKEDYAVVSSKVQGTFDGSRKSYLAARHVLVSFSGELRGIVDETLAAQGRTRQVAAGFPNFFPALATVSESDMIATVPRRLANAFAQRFQLSLHEPPFAVRTFPISLLRHRRSAKDGAVNWLAAQLQQLTSGPLG
jgi:DNA-binding transcriptional LysR family regulator